ncbi:SCO2524 family protein [Actinoplanes sp. CA-142083]|uniref:SCO2524 family protein n=1 Tax=Actinoplanes sp. CA-142083 TaxID=3239903 RepID=UPI003D913A0B
MRIDPRQRLLETWAATVQASWRGGIWHWGGRDGSNSISDAEQLLCILLPAAKVLPLALDRPETMSEHALRALAPLGDANTIPLTLIRIATEYFERYTTYEPRSIFAGGTYFDLDTGRNGELQDWQRERDVVDSYAVSLTLSLVVRGFARLFQPVLTQAGHLAQAQRLERVASLRLTAAMIGLLRSFSTNVFDPGSEEGHVLIDTVNRGSLPRREVASQLRAALRPTTRRLGEVEIGSGQIFELDDASLFECGWSWGTVTEAPQVYVDDPEILLGQLAGFAEDRPHLYFTAVALDAIEELLSERTRELSLLDAEQYQLARELMLRRDLALSYWTTLATFTDGWQWPLEARRDDYHTLLLSSVLVKDLSQPGPRAQDLARVGRVLADLSDGLRLAPEAQPGQVITLIDRETQAWDEPQAAWVAGDFAPVLLRNSVAIAGMLRDGRQRTQMLRLADHTWDHLDGRRMGPEATPGLWDRSADHRLPSWRCTLRVVEALISAADVLERRGAARRSEGAAVGGDR